MRVLCIAPRWLGDAILSRAAVHALVGSGVEVCLLVRPPLGRVYEDLVGEQRVHTFTGSGRVRRFEAALRLRRMGWDAALVLAPSFSSALCAVASGARLRVGLRGDARRLLLTHSQRARRDVHFAVQCLELAKLLLGSLGQGLHSVAGESPLLRPRPEETSAARRLLESLGLAGRDPLLVAPGARFGAAKRYPADRFASAARLLAERDGSPVLLVGEAADAGATAEVAAGCPEAIDLAGRTSLGELIGLLAAARGVLSNDSGTMHLSAALGTPVVGIFGSTSRAWTHPIGPRARSVSVPVWCAPCYARTCAQDFACMLRIAPETLVEEYDRARAGERDWDAMPARL